jgi:hypothetical protein
MSTELTKLTKLTKKVLGIPSQHEREYAKPERLADVMALIQVLALDRRAHRSSGGLHTELQGGPSSSAESWKSLAQEHPEFFRVLVFGEEKNNVSLIARHVQRRPHQESGREPLSADFVGNLLRSAVEIHDRRVRRTEVWRYLVPIWGALFTAIITGFFGLLIAFFG